MNKKDKNQLLVGSVVTIALILAIILIVNISRPPEVKNLIEITGYYDANGNPIMVGKVTPLSVVNSVEGVKYITVNINALNKDTIPLNFDIESLSPTSFSDSIIPSTLVAEPGAYATWESDLIDVEPFEGSTLNLAVSITASAPPYRDPLTKSAELSFNVGVNPVANFDLEFTSSINPDSEFPIILLPFGIPDLSIYDQINRLTVSRVIDGVVSYEAQTSMGTYDQAYWEITYTGKDGVSAGEFGGTFEVIYPVGISSVNCEFSNSIDALPSDIFGTLTTVDSGYLHKTYSYGVTEDKDIPFDGSSQLVRRINCKIKNGGTSMVGREITFKFIPASYYLNSNNENILDTQDESGNFVMDYQPIIKSIFSA